MKRYQSFKVKSKIAGKKGAKSGDMNATLKLLVDSFGGERALARKSPICAGRYNSTKANDVNSCVFVTFNDAIPPRVQDFC